MDEVIELLSAALKSPDQQRANASRRILARYASVLARNSNHPSSEKFIQLITTLLKESGEEWDLKPATEVASFLQEEGDSQPVREPVEAASSKAFSAPRDKSPEIAPQEKSGPSAGAPGEPGGGDTASSVPGTSAEKASATPSAAPSPAAAGQTPAPTASIPNLTRPQAIQPPAPRTGLPPPTRGAPAATMDSAAKTPSPARVPRIVSAPNPGANDPSLQVTTVLAPAKSRAGYAPKAAAETAGINEAPEESLNSVLNLVAEKLSGEDERQLETGLKLIARVSRVIVSDMEKGGSESSRNLLGRVRSLLAHKNKLVQVAAAGAAGALRDRIALRPLIEMLASEDDPTHRAAHEALKTITDRDLGDAAEPWLKYAGEAK